MPSKNNNNNKKKNNDNTKNKSRLRDIKWYGWTPDLPDHRDHKYAIKPNIVPESLPERIDLRDKCPPVYDQGSLGSCTANAIGAAMQYEDIKQNQGPKDFVPSRLFIYYNERVIEHTVKEDSGAMIRDGIKTVAKDGACHETRWPYNINRFRTRPNKKCYAEAKQFEALKYERLDNTNIDMLKSCLADMTPFIFGFTVYDSFETEQVEKTGEVPMPAEEENELGGHAVLAVGYDDTTKRFICRNSWGKDWGQEGYFTMPYEYVTDDNLADDFWNISLVSS